MKTQHGQVTMPQHTTACVLHTKGVGGIVDNLEIVVVSYLLDGLHVTGVAIAMYRHDGGGLRSNGGFDASRVEVECVGVHIHKHGFDAVPEQRVGGGNE
ncbi:hypothetical protein D3C85_1637260 [compost metagenome]